MSDKKPLNENATLNQINNNITKLFKCMKSMQDYLIENDKVNRLYFKINKLDSSNNHQLLNLLLLKFTRLDKSLDDLLTNSNLKYDISEDYLKSIDNLENDSRDLGELIDSCNRLNKRYNDLKGINDKLNDEFVALSSQPLNSNTLNLSEMSTIETDQDNSETSESYQQSQSDKDSQSDN